MLMCKISPIYLLCARFTVGDLDINTFHKQGGNVWIWGHYWTLLKKIIDHVLLMEERNLGGFSTAVLRLTTNYFKGGVLYSSDISTKEKT